MYCRQGRVLGHLLPILLTADMFSVVADKMFKYTNDFTLLAVVYSLFRRRATADTHGSDLQFIDERCSR